MRNLVRLGLLHVSILVNIYKIQLWIDIFKKNPSIFTFFFKYAFFEHGEGELLATQNRNISCNTKFRTSNLKTNRSSRNLESMNNIINNDFFLFDRHHPVKPLHQVKLHPVKPPHQAKFHPVKPPHQVK